MKKAIIKFSSVIFALLTLLALCTVLCAVLFVPSAIASADSGDTVTVNVIKAPASNLTDNKYAGKSNLKIISGNDIIYVPESYFVQYDKLYAGSMHYVIYGGRKFYFDGEPTTMQITLSEGEQLFPNVILTLKNGEPVKIGYIDITDSYTIKFLGYNEDSTELYVSASLENNDPIPGFIPADSVNPFVVPYQSRTQAEYDELHAPKPDVPIIEDGHFTPNTSVALRIIIIIGIAIPAILIVILLFKPSKNERRYAKNSVRSTRGRDEFDYDDSRSYRRRDDRDDRDRDRYDDRYDRRDNRDRDRDRDYDRNYDRRDDRYDDDYR